MLSAASCISLRISDQAGVLKETGHAGNDQQQVSGDCPGAFQLFLTFGHPTFHAGGNDETLDAHHRAQRFQGGDEQQDTAWHHIFQELVEARERAQAEREAGAQGSHQLQGAPPRHVFRRGGALGFISYSRIYFGLDSGIISDTC